MARELRSPKNVLFPGPSGLPTVSERTRSIFGKYSGYVWNVQETNLTHAPEPPPSCSSAGCFARPSWISRYYERSESFREPEHWHFNSHTSFQTPRPHIYAESFFSVRRRDQPTIRPDSKSTPLPHSPWKRKRLFHWTETTPSGPTIRINFEHLQQFDYFDFSSNSSRTRECETLK